jgi:hypothetical protein
MCVYVSSFAHDRRFPKENAHDRRFPKENAHDRIFPKEKSRLPLVFVKEAV